MKFRIRIELENQDIGSEQVICVYFIQDAHLGKYFQLTPHIAKAGVFEPNVINEIVNYYCDRKIKIYKIEMEAV